MITINGETTHSTDFIEVLRWLTENSRYLNWLGAETDDEELLSECVRFITQNYGSSSYDSFIGFKQMVESAEHIRKLPGVNELQGLFKGVPAILALSGPSLNKQLPHLKTLQDKTVIIATDTALKVLEAAGITPHFVCKKERFENTTKAVEGKHKSVLVLCPVCPPDVYKRYDGPIVIGMRDYAHFKWLPFDKGYLPKPGTVGNMCFNLAELLGCSPIILIGADHAFTADRSHAVGSEQYTGNQIGACEVLGIDGTILKTSQEFADAIKVFERDAKARGDVWNCTEGGALIEGCINKEFRNTQFPTKHIRQSKILRSFSKYVPPKTEWNGLRKKTSRRLQKIIDKCEQGLKGNASVKDVILADTEMWNLLVIHVVQPFHLCWMMEGAEDLLTWFMAVRDCVRRIQDVIENTRMV